MAFSSAFSFGTLLALLAAVAFGVTVPAVQAAGAGVGAFATAALLYAGAALAAFALSSFRIGPIVEVARRHAIRLLTVALFGAALAPTLFAWGLQHTGATSASLLLNMEAVFTVILAWALLSEPIGARVAVALVMMTCGGIALSLQQVNRVDWQVAGALAITGATFCWSCDNTLSRRLSEQAPLQIVAAKSGVGSLLSAVVAALVGDPRPTAGRAVALLACGAVGYGVSLGFYLSAQRRIGAARTGSTFAIAPFIAAGTAWLCGDRQMTSISGISATLFAVGVYLHATERHRHRHVHEPIEHSHSHRHDDGHHNHTHDPPVAGEHQHSHRHERLEHEHEHAPDIHHRHSH
ncbi:MAG TPA: DMT family transporter [Polyangiaceae bacterium]|nr:DMT family transporter [Polyangiaceae bacterium]